MNVEKNETNFTNKPWGFYPVTKLSSNKMGEETHHLLSDETLATQKKDLLS